MAKVFGKVCYLIMSMWGNGYKIELMVMGLIHGLMVFN